MKYNKKYGKKKRYSRKKGKALSKKVDALSKFVYKTIERKQVTLHNETEFSPGTTPNNIISDALWTGCELTEMDSNPTGATNEQRVGNQITLGTLNLRIMFEDISPVWKVRLMIVQFPNPQGALDINTLANNVLQYGEINASSETRESHVIMSPYRVGGTVNYRVLYDKLFTAPTGSNSSLLTRNIKINRKTKGFKNVLEFKADAPNSVSAYKNNVFAFWRMTDNNLNIGAPTIKDVSFIRRMSYRDA